MKIFKPHNQSKTGDGIFSGKNKILKHGRVKVRINAYLYPDPASEQPIRCPIKILPGTSPIRDALGDNPILGTDEERRYADSPLDRIIYDKISSEGEMAETIPSDIVEQMGNLPPEIAEQIEFDIQEDRISLNAPLSYGARFLVSYDMTSDDHRIYTAHIIHRDIENAVNLTELILQKGSALPLEKAHRYAELLVAGILKIWRSSAKEPDKTGDGCRENYSDRPAKNNNIGEESDVE